MGVTRATMLPVRATVEEVMSAVENGKETF
jgi:hypothetical protein